MSQFDRRDKILGGLGLIQLGKEFARLVFVTRVAAERRQGVGREGHEVVERHTPCDVFDVGIETAVFVDDKDAGELTRRIRRPREVAAHLAGALR